MSNLSAFPTDDQTLSLIYESFDGAYEVDPDGTHRWVGSEFSFHQLLDFYSGYDPALSIPLNEEETLFEYKGPLYGERDVIRALIDEIRRLRDQA